MTAMDDLLNSSSIGLYPVTVVATWQELEPGYSNVTAGSVNGPDSIKQVGKQIGPNGIDVSHSFDDGLPDAVTATGQNDACGSMTMDLVGRPPATAAASSLHWNALSTTGSGTGTTITTTLPADPAFWDYVLVAITVNSDTLISETSMDPDSFWIWNKLADISDGGFHTYVFGRKHFTTGVVAPVFKLDASASYAWVIGSIDVGKTASLEVMVPISPGDIEIVGEVSSVTTHNQTPVTIGNRGWNVGIFGGANTAGPWTSTGNTIVGQVSGSGVSTALITSPLRSIAGIYQMAANSNAATANVAMIHLAMEVRDRPAMDAVGYFSPFNTMSPVYGFDRDTATMQVATNHLALDGTGIETNLIFTGQMASVDISGRTATLNGVSRTRLLLDDSHTLPTVYGWREGCTTDWVTGWLLAQGGQYIGIAPSVYTRWWAPMYGSMHPYMGGSSDYTVCNEWNISRPALYRRDAQDTTGPFATAMFAQQTDSSVITLNGTTDRNWATEVPGQPDAVFADLFSQANSVGEITFWLRADPWVTNPSAITTGNPDDNLLFSCSIWNNYLGSALPGIKININASGNFSVWCGGSGATLNGANMTADGLWHLFGFKWDYHGGVAVFRHNNITWGLSAQTSANDVLPATDAVMYAAGGYNVMTYTSHLPLAEMQLEAGQPYANNFDRFLGTPAAPSVNALYRPTRQPLATIANPNPVQGWTTLQSLAQSTLSHLRVNEDDNAEFLPLDYFGETAQMTVETLNVLDTDFNAGELGLALDPTQSRNVATIEFTDTRVGSQRVSILEMNTSLAIPRGVTVVTFALDTPTAETHGAAAWWTATPTFQKLTALQVAGTNAIQNENVMSVNTLADGTGTVFVSTAFTARIIDWTSNTIDVQFTNTYSATLYLSNNGTQIPFLRALGYPITTSDGYSTVRDDGSIGRRRERALTTGMEWVQDRETAQQVGSTLVTLLSEPRPTISVTVQGDPRRRPGKLTQLVDSTGMKADGTWRIMRIDHHYNGPQYTQDLDLVRVGEIANWDEGNWDETVWGE
jgi:hypothetical protein